MSVFTVRDLAALGALPVVRFTPRSRMRFRPEDVDKVAETRTVEIARSKERS